jgi:hypothetical protein
MNEDCISGSLLRPGHVFKARGRWYLLHHVIAESGRYRVVAGVPRRLAAGLAGLAASRPDKPGHFEIGQSDLKPLYVSRDDDYPVREQP